MIKKYIQGRSEFSRNVAIMFSGTAFAQVVPLLVSPVLARLYSPSDFAVFGVYIALVSIVATIATARYELAIVLPESEEDAKSIFLLSIFVAILFSVMLFLFVAFFGREISAVIGNDDLLPWLYLLPLSAALNGLFQVFKYWHVRRKVFKRVAYASVSQSLTGSTANIGLGVLGITSGGLIIGSIIGSCVSLMVYMRSALFLFSRGQLSIGIKGIVSNAKKYSSFPIYDMPAGLLFTLYSNMAIIFISRYFDPFVAGLFFFANRIITFPISILVRSLSDVFYQKLARDTKGSDFLIEITSFSKKLFLIFILPYLVLVYSSKYYCGMIFGEEWADLYAYIYVLSLPALFRLVLSPYGHVLKVIGRQDLSFKIHLFRFFVVVLFFLSYKIYEPPSVTFLYLFAILDSFIHLVMAGLVDRLVAGKLVLKYSAARAVLWIVLSVLNAYLLF